MGFRDTLRTIRKKISKKASLALAAALVVGGITGAVATKSVKADSRNCDNNAVVYCGAFSIPELQARYKSDSVTRAIYAASPFNISATDVAGMGNAKVGAVYKDGRVVVDGRVVATGAITAGRQWIAGSTKLVGAPGYSRPPSVSFKQNSLSAFVKFDANGQFDFAIIMSCGNPVTARPTPPPAKPSFKIEKKVRIYGSNSAWAEDVKVTPGQKVEYVIAVTNTGNVALTNMRVHDTLPAGMSYVKNSTNITTSYNGHHLVPDGITSGGVNIGTVPAGGTAFVFFAAIAPAANNTSIKLCSTGNTSLTNHGYAKPTELPEKTDDAKIHTCRPDQPNFTIQKKVKIANTDDLFAEDVTADPGTLLQFVIGVQNTGNTVLKNVVVKDVLPAGLTYKAGTSTLTNSVGVSNKKLPDTLVTSGYTIPSMAVGEVDFIFFQAYLPQATNPIVKECETGKTKLTNKASATPQGLTTKEDTASAETCKKTPNFTIQKDVRKVGDSNWQQDVTVNYGDTVEYRILVKNTGATDLKNMVVKDARPTGVDYVAGSLKVNGQSNSGDLFGKGLTIAQINKGGQAEITFQAKVKGQPENCTTGKFHNIASAQPTGLEPKQDDADVTATCIVTHPGVKIEKTVSQTEVPVNGKFTYTLVVTNTGDVNLTNVKVSDPAPEGVNFLSADKPAGTTVNVTATNFAATIAKMTPGQKVTFNIESQVVKQISGKITNTACVDAPEVPGNPDDCSTVKIETPSYACTALTALSLGDLKYRFTPQIVKTGSVTLTSVTYDFGDGSDKVTQNNANAVEHTYTQADEDKTYNVDAAVVFNVSGVAQTVHCVAQVKITGTPEEVCPYNPNLPKDDKDCVPPCTYNPEIPSNDKECQPPKDVCPEMPGTQTNPEDCKTTPPVTVIPSTGAGDIVGGAAGISATTYGVAAFLSKRRALKNLK